MDRFLGALKMPTKLLENLRAWPRTASKHGRPSTRAILFSTAFSLFILAVACAPYRHFVADDTLISLRYAERFLQGHGLTWSEGARVEGYSNFSWVMLCAALGRLGLDLVVASKALGVLCMSSVCVSLAAVARFGPCPSRSVFPLFVAQLFWVSLGPTAVWAMGGLEQPLVVASWVAAAACLLVASSRSRAMPWIFWSSAALALHTLTRPDGILQAVLLAASWIFCQDEVKARPRWIDGLLIVSLPVAAWVGLTAFRYHYYDALVPNTALIKISFSLSRLTGGLRYVALAISSIALIIVPSLLWALYRGRQSQALRLGWNFLALGSVWLAYLVFIGGDIFPSHRHMTLFFGVFALSFLFWMQDLESVLASRFSAARLKTVSFLVFCIFGMAQHRTADTQAAQRERWEWNGKAVGEALLAAFGKEEPTFAVTAAGSLPYYSKLPSIDQLGLNDRYIAEHPSKGAGKGQLGHDFGNGAYVLGRKPEIISLCGVFGALSPCFSGGKEMYEMPEFTESYRPVALRIQHTSKTQRRRDEDWFISWLWFRWNSPKVGLRELPGENPQRIAFSVPAFLGANSEQLPTELEADELVVHLAPGQQIRLPLPGELIDLRGGLELKGPDGLHLLPFLDTGLQEVRLENRSKELLTLGRVEVYGNRGVGRPVLAR